ncbi:MAG: M48 family metallopeptidase [Elusimicrobiota bacterium]
MREQLPLVLAVAAAGAAFLVARAGPSRESVLPLSRAVADHEKGVDRASAVVFPLTAEEERSIGSEMARAFVDPSPASAPGSPAFAREALWREATGEAARSPLIQRFAGLYVFKVVENPSPNAFALPGGYVFATSALLERLAGDFDALMFVAGHEIGHVELGHTADAYRLRAQGRDPITVVIGGALSIPRLFAELHFSQTQELEADAFAVALLRSRGRDPRAGLRVFDALGLAKDAATKRGPDEIAVEGMTDYFRTHPGSWERRAALERRIETAQ